MPARPAEPLLTSQPDQRLVDLVRAGDQRAFTTIVERYRQELLALARRLRSDGRAEDLVQQAFLSAFAALQSGTEVKHLRGWLYRILRNEAMRSSSRSALEVELDPGSVATESLEDAAQRRMLAFQTLASIAALPTRQRDAIVGTAIDGRSRASVAGEMGLSEGAVRQLMHRARTTLRAAVAAIAPGPLANWIRTGRSAGAGDPGPEIVIGAGAGAGAGAASAGCMALKVGTILASGVVATGIVASQLTPAHQRAAIGHAPAPHVTAARVHEVSSVSYAGTVTAVRGGRIVLLNGGGNGAIPSGARFLTDGHTAGPNAPSSPVPGHRGSGAGVTGNTDASGDGMSGDGDQHAGGGSSSRGTSDSGGEASPRGGSGTDGGVGGQDGSGTTDGGRSTSNVTSGSDGQDGGSSGDAGSSTGGFIGGSAPSSTGSSDGESSGTGSTDGSNSTTSGSDGSGGG